MQQLFGVGPQLRLQPAQDSKRILPNRARALRSGHRCSTGIGEGVVQLLECCRAAGKCGALGLHHGSAVVRGRSLLQHRQRHLFRVGAYRAGSGRHGVNGSTQRPAQGHLAELVERRKHQHQPRTHGQQTSAAAGRGRTRAILQLLARYLRRRLHHGAMFCVDRR